ncbi:alpha/beta hydrolase [Nesterenkonia muleiensis]|uniref:alpha/beta hydrolase n=1 Tax=Nesterenkonia muleiensis TaxID=2282648 RepID=UPI0013905765|nr:alpha/beta hydrolase fold domain-containing protein [Nesterenkonia muleiensis]
MEESAQVQKAAKSTAPVVVTDHTAQGPRGEIPLRRYVSGAQARPGTAPSGRTLIWLHGGGFFFGGLEMPEAHDVAAVLALRGIEVLTVDYTLAPPPFVPVRGTGRVSRPRHRYPAALDDVMAAVRWARLRSGDDIFLGGASAGACLASTAALRLAQEETAVRGAVLVYGFFHRSNPELGRELRRKIRGRRRLYHGRLARGVMIRNYAGGRRRPGDPAAFPGGTMLRNHPPALVINAERDTFRASGDLYAQELISAGVPTEHHVMAGSSHAFLNNPQSRHFKPGIRLIQQWLHRS